MNDLPPNFWTLHLWCPQRFQAPTQIVGKAGWPPHGNKSAEDAKMQMIQYTKTYHIAWLCSLHVDLLFLFTLGNLKILMWDDGLHPQVPIHSCKLEASVSRPSRLLWQRTNAASWLLRHFWSSNGSKVAMKACTDNCDWISCWKRTSNASCSYSSDTSFESLRVLFHLETCEKPRRWPWTKMSNNKHI